MKKLFLATLSVLFFGSAVYVLTNKNNSSVSLVNPAVVLAEPTATPSATPTVTATPSATPTPIPVPGVIVRTPVDGTIVKRNNFVVTEAVVSDTTYVQMVEFFVNGEFKCSDLQTPYNCTWKTSNEKSKNYSIYAKASGSFGTTLSPVVNVSSR